LPSIISTYVKRFFIAKNWIRRALLCPKYSYESK